MSRCPINGHYLRLHLVTFTLVLALYKNQVHEVCCMQVLDQVKIKSEVDRDVLVNIARTSLRTKLQEDLADLLTEVFMLLFY